MAGINIQLPVMDAEHSIEIEVRINGSKKKHQYRVEIFNWDDCSQQVTQAECLREMIQHYDQNWRVVQIGGPTKSSIPIMFKQGSN